MRVGEGEGVGLSEMTGKDGRVKERERERGGGEKRGRGDFERDR